MEGDLQLLNPGDVLAIVFSVVQGLDLMHELRHDGLMLEQVTLGLVVVALDLDKLDTEVQLIVREFTESMS